MKQGALLKPEGEEVGNEESCGKGRKTETAQRSNIKKCEGQGHIVVARTLFHAAALSRCDEAAVLCT